MDESSYTLPGHRHPRARPWGHLPGRCEVVSPIISVCTSSTANRNKLLADVADEERGIVDLAVRALSRCDEHDSLKCDEGTVAIEISKSGNHDLARCRTGQFHLDICGFVDAEVQRSPSGLLESFLRRGRAEGGQNPSSKEQQGAEGVTGVASGRIQFGPHLR